jgi:radical SAM superfamily enzyme YgiQ (UPF0313 family)
MYYDDLLYILAIMKILLINPASPNTFWSLKHTLKFVSKKAVLPPLGLLTVAAMLPKDWELKLIDIAVTPLTDRDINWADYVFITGMYIHTQSMRSIIDRCKKLQKKLVAGGPLFTAVPEDYDDVDHLVLNEAELTLPQFLKDLQNGSAAHIYKSDRLADLKDTPVPLWRLIDFKQYALMSIQYSRGCPFNCDFCDVTTLLGHKSRTKGKSQLLTELESLYLQGWRKDVFLVDDNFIGNKELLKKEILPAIINWMEKRNYPFSFNTQTSINLADDDELMTLMTQAAFDCVFVGIETTNQDSLTECNKLQNRNRDLLDCVKKIQHAGMQVQAGFILGFDHDNISVFDNLINFIQSSGIVTAMVGLLNAPKGTKLYTRLLNEKRLTNYGSGNNTDFTMNFIPVMNRKDLLDGYRKVIRTIYSHKDYYNRILVLLKNYRPAKRTGGSLDYSDIKAFLKSIWHLGILHKGRRYYWKLMLRALRHPQYLNLICTLAIYGFHFRKVFEELERL